MNHKIREKVRGKAQRAAGLIVSGLAPLEVPRYQTSAILSFLNFARLLITDERTGRELS